MGLFKRYAVCSSRERTNAIAAINCDPKLLIPAQCLHPVEYEFIAGINIYSLGGGFESESESMSGGQKQEQEVSGTQPQRRGHGRL